MAAQPSSDWCGNNPRNEMRMAKVDSARRVVLTSMSGRWGSMVVGGPVLKFVSSKTVSPLFPIFGLTAVLKILSFGALALGDNIANL